MAARAKGEKTREKLVGAAAQVFNEVGYHGTDSNRIARAAGYAPATFYKHFTDKREIFLAAYERWVETEWEGIRAELSGRQRGALARVSRLILEHHRRWAGFRTSLRALAATDEAVRAFRIDRRGDQLVFMEDLLQAAGGPLPSRSDCLFALLCFERTCDAIADGEVAALGISEAAILRRLREELQSLADSK